MIARTCTINLISINGYHKVLINTHSGVKTVLKTNRRKRSFSPIYEVGNLVKNNFYEKAS